MRKAYWIAGGVAVAGGGYFAYRWWEEQQAEKALAAAATTEEQAITGGLIAPGIEPVAAPLELEYVPPSQTPALTARQRRRARRRRRRALAAFRRLLRRRGKRQLTPTKSKVLSSPTYVTTDGKTIVNGAGGVWFPPVKDRLEIDTGLNAAMTGL